MYFDIKNILIRVVYS